MIASLTDAKLLHDLTIQAENDAWFEAYGDSPAVDFNVPQSLRLKYEEARRSRREFERELMSYPFLWPHMRCLMVDIISANNTCEYIAIDTMVDILDPVNELDEDVTVLDNDTAFELLMGRELPKRIYDWLINHRFRVPDRGLGSRSWHLGVHCTFQEAEDLCTTVRHKFAEAFANGVIRMNMKPWSISWKE